MSYQVMAEVAKRKLAREIEVICTRELAAHREAFTPKPDPFMADLIQRQRENNAFQRQRYAMMNRAQQMQALHGAQHPFYQGNQLAGAYGNQTTPLLSGLAAMFGVIV